MRRRWGPAARTTHANAQEKRLFESSFDKLQDTARNARTEPAEFKLNHRLSRTTRKRRPTSLGSARVPFARASRRARIALACAKHKQADQRKARHKAPSPIKSACRIIKQRCRIIRQNQSEPTAFLALGAPLLRGALQIDQHSGKQKPRRGPKQCQGSCGSKAKVTRALRPGD